MKKVLVCALSAFILLGFASTASAATFGTTDVGTSTYDGVDFENVDIIDLDPDDPAWQLIIDPAGEFMYVPVAYSSIIHKVDLDTFAIVDTFYYNSDDAIYDGNAVAIDPTGDYMYVGTAGSPSRVLKIDLDTFTNVATTTLGANHGSILSLSVDHAGTYAYVAAYDAAGALNPSHFTQIDLNTFATTTTRTLSTGEYNIRSIIIDSNDAFAYLTARVTNGYVIKMNLSSMTRVGALDPRTTLGVNFGLTNSGFIDADGTYLYIMNGGGRISQIDLSNFSFGDTMVLSGPSNATESWNVAYATATNQAYYSGYESPGLIAQVDLDSFTQVATATLDAAAEYTLTVAVDPSGEYVYSSGETYPGHVSRTALPTLNATFPAGNVLASEVTLTETAQSIDSVSFYSHAATGNVRVAIYDDGNDLLWESGSVANATTDGWVTISIADGTPTALSSIPAGTYYLALQTDTSTDIFSATTSASSGRTLAQSYGAFPSSLSAAEVTDQLWSIYATYTAVPPVEEEDSAGGGGSSRTKTAIEKLKELADEPIPSAATTTDEAQIRALQQKLIDLLTQIIALLIAQRGN